METARTQFGRRGARYSSMILLDATAFALSLLIALELRISGPLSPALLSLGLHGALIGAAIAAGVFHMAGIYRQTWRYTSVRDLLFLAEVSVLAVVLSTLATVLFLSATVWLPRSVPVIQWNVFVVMLVSLRVARRLAREFLGTRATHRASANPSLAPTQDVKGTLLIGGLDWAETQLRGVSKPSVEVVGILSHDTRDHRLRVRGVQVLGSVDEFENVVAALILANRKPQRVVIDALDPCLTGARTANLAIRAKQLGLELVRSAGGGRTKQADNGVADLASFNLNDLIDRAELNLDNSVVRQAIEGRRILVTGAGGTIGSELVRQIAAMSPTEIMLVEHAEYSLYAIDLELRERFPAVKSTPLLCSIRQRESLRLAFCEHKPDLVFHAAALKHVPLVETNVCAGVLTNVVGTRNVADAVLACGAKAMIAVSTDKAVNPVGMMGAAKRLGELYCQALDLAMPDSEGVCRFLTVRFGNVMGSSGSLIPLFMRQLSRNGPLTVTHPDIERFFMTVHEAVELILHSSAATLQTGHSQSGKARGRIFVLDMGKPIKIMDVAKRLIRAAGLVPDVDIKIEIVGLRPGEKLFEELFDTNEKRLPSTLPGIFEAEPNAIPLERLDAIFSQLEELTLNGLAEPVRALMRSVIDFHDCEASPTPPAAAKWQAAAVGPAIPALAMIPVSAVILPAPALASLSADVRRLAEAGL